MADKFLTLNGGVPTLREGLATSAGAGDAGKIPALDAAGKLSSTMMPAGIGADTVVAPASENLSAGDFVNLWNDGGTLKVRKADASDSGKAADGFVDSAVTAPANATVILDGTNANVSGLTIGVQQYLSDGTPGAPTATAPSSSNSIIQALGKAKSATELVFERGEPVLIE